MRATGIFTIALALMTSAALAQKVNTNYDKEADFSQIKTFAVKVGTSWNNPISEKQVATEVERALSAKGWTPAEEGQADALVVLHGATEEKKDINTFYDGWGGWGWYGGGMGTATTSVTSYTEGTLVVDIFDAQNKELIFRGTAKDELSDKPEKNIQKAEKATKKMFKEFPPGTEKDEKDEK
jgi:hypothetical protein